MTATSERRTTKGDTLVFVSFCGGCPHLRPARGRRTPARCTLLDMEILNTHRIFEDCPLEGRR